MQIAALDDVSGNLRVRDAVTQSTTDEQLAEIFAGVDGQHEDARRAEAIAFFGG